jgi:hypothetical protein
MQYEGPCRGGPLDGVRFGTNKPEGFLVVNRDLHQVAIYDSVEVGSGSRVFQIRTDASGVWVRPEQRGKRWMAALEGSYDVFPYDPERMPPWRP